MNKRKWMEMLLPPVLALVCAGGFFAWNIRLGPLSNLNDIGGWDRRLLFMTAASAVLFALLLLPFALSRSRGVLRVLLRQGILMAGMVIYLLAINQKTYAYTTQIQPLLRKLQAGGLGALPADSPVSAPMALLLMGVTRFPSYDMYSVKLVSVFCVLAAACIAGHLADEERMGLRAEATLVLCVILPQAFLSSACAAQLDSVALLFAALALLSWRSGRRTPAAVLLGVAATLNLVFAAGFVLMVLEGGRRELLPGLCPAAAGVLLCTLAGLSPLRAAGSLLAPLLSPPFAKGGMPTLASIIPYARPSEMPSWFLIHALPHAQLEVEETLVYTPEHVVLLQRGMAVAGLGVLAALLPRMLERLRGNERLLGVLLLSLMCVPGTSAACWLSVCFVAVLIVQKGPSRLRIPAAAVLLGIAGGAAYPVTGETMVPAGALWLGAIVLLLGIAGVIPFPGGARDGE